MAPVEGSRDIPEKTAGGLAIDDARINEDNIVLFLVRYHDHDYVLRFAHFPRLG